MHNDTETSQAYPSKKVNAELYIDNGIANGSVTEIGLTFDRTISFLKKDNVHRVSMLIGHGVMGGNTQILSKKITSDDGSLVKTFQHQRDKEIWQWILDNIEP